MDDDIIWSGTDFPYACLIDNQRTLAYKKAILETVQPGDTVVDIGSGSGILAFFAAAAGAKKVYAVEIDHFLAESLRQSIQANSLENVIEVVEGDALKVELPKEVNVLLAEIIETGLLEEMQLKVMNHLRETGVIGLNTKVLPAAYETFIKLIDIENSFYGYKIFAPIHNWPYYADADNGWEQIKKQDITTAQSLGHFDFQANKVAAEVDATINVSLPAGKTANAVELTGLAHLTPNISLGATNAFNGPKILYIDPIAGPHEFKLRVNYTMGKGLGTIKFEPLSA